MITLCYSQGADEFNINMFKETFSERFMKFYVVVNDKKRLHYTKIKMSR